MSLILTIRKESSCLGSFLCIERIFLIVALGRKQPAKAVSLLKLEPKVSSFPVLESVITDSSAHATEKILSIF